MCARSTTQSPFPSTPKPSPPLRSSPLEGRTKAVRRQTQFGQVAPRLKFDPSFGGSFLTVRSHQLGCRPGASLENFARQIRHGHTSPFGMDPCTRELQRLPHQVLELQQRLHLPNVPLVTPTRTAKRCLFGPTEFTTTRAALERILSEETERCIKKWEFDPMIGKPVANPKRYDWVSTCEEIEAPWAAKEGEKEKERAERRDQNPSDAIRLRGMERGQHPGGEQSDPPAAEASLPVGGCGDLRADDDAVRSRDEVEGVCPGMRFAPYPQRRITDYWKKKKSGGESKARSQVAASDAAGRQEAEARQGDGGQ